MAFEQLGVEFLFVPAESQQTLTRIVSGSLSPALPVLIPDQKHGIHSTVCRDEWVYEIREPIPGAQGWQAQSPDRVGSAWSRGHYVTGLCRVGPGGLAGAGIWPSDEDD